MPKAFVSRPSERELRSGIVRCGRLLAEHDFAPATSGNISARLDERRVLITPTGVPKSELREEDIAVVDPSGRKLSGRRTPTSEMGMHLAIYELRPDAEAVVHAHPPVATGFACAGIALDQPLASEFVMALGCAPLAPYATPGTEEVAASLRRLARGHDAILLSNHGAVTYGKSLDDAWSKMEMVEHFAKIALTVRLLGRQQPITEADILKLMEARDRYCAGCTRGAAPSRGEGGEPRQSPIGSPGSGTVPAAAPAASQPQSAAELRDIVEAVVRRVLTARTEKWEDRAPR